MSKLTEYKKNLLDGASTGLQRPPRISILGNQFTLIDPSGKRTNVGPTIHLVFIDRNENTSKLFWGEGKFYNPSEIAPPLCFSDNGVAPSAMAQEPQNPTCDTCKHNIIGSAMGFSGAKIKACQDLKKFAVIAQGYPGVYLFEIKPGSFKAWNKHVAWLQMQKMADGGKPDLSDVITLVQFTGVGVMSFEGVALTEDEEELTNQVIDVWERNKQSDITGLMVGRFDQPAQGVLPAAQAPKEIAAPAPTAVNPAPPAQGERNIFAKPVEPAPAKKAKKAEPAPIEPKQPQHGMQTPQGTPPSEISKRLENLFKLPTVK